MRNENAIHATPEHQPNQPGSNPNEIRVAGSNRIYDRRKLLIVLLVPMMMALVQISSVNNALPALTDALGASDSALQWVLSGYALAIGIVLVPAGRIGDIIGRSSMFVVGLVLFTIASLAVGLSPDPLTLNILRIVQGIGAGLYSPQVTGLILQYFSGHARARAFSLLGLVVSVSVAIGPILSGFLISTLGNDLGWRGGFIVNVPIGVVGIVLALRWLPFGKERRTVGPNHDEVQAEFERMEKAEGRTPVKRRGKIDIDPLGITLLSIAVLCIMLPFMIDGSPWIWALLAFGLVLSTVWIWWEKRYKAHGHFPMVDLSLFEIRSFSYSTLSATILFLGSTSVMAVLAIFLQKGLNVSALEVGFIMLPNAIASAYAAIWSGKRAVDHGRGVMVLCITLVLLSVLAMTALAWGIEHGLHYWWIALPSALLGFGFGAYGAANQTIGMMDVPLAHGGTAGGLMQTGQRIATAVGTAIVTAVFFFGQSHGEGAQDWYFGISLAFILVSILVVISLVIALIFWREGYAERHAVPAREVLKK